MQTLTRKRKIHRAQLQFLRSTALFRGFVGGRSAGKSWIGAYDLLRRAERGRTYLVASPTGVLLHDTTFPRLKELAQELGIWGPVTVDVLPEVLFAPTGQSEVKMTPYPTVRLTTGATVRFRTAEDPEKLRGPDLSGIWLDEASLMSEEAFNVSIACLREKGRQGWLTATFTPKGFSHWTFKVFGKARPDTDIVHSDTGDNPFNPPGFRATLAFQYSPQRQRQELGGEFVAIEGAEWPPEYFPDDIFFRDWPAGPWVASAMALDPSKGKDATKPKEGRAPDYSAFVWGAVDGQGVTWVDADLDNVRDVARLVEDGLYHFRTFNPRAFVIEVSQFQSLIGGLFFEEAKKINLTLPLWGIDNHENKLVRIRASVTPELAQRKLRVRDTPGGRLLVAQLRDFPQGAYDDGPDSLEMTLRMLKYLLAGGQGANQPKVLRP